MSRPFCAIVVLALCAWCVHAQSGRRHTQPPPPAPVPTPTPEPTPSPKKPEKESDSLFFVGSDRNDAFLNIPLSYHDAALKGCVERLRSGTSASVDVTNKSFSRGEAIKKAKAETGSYVVLLTLKLDTMARSYDDLVLEFVVFAPTTAKVVTTGRSFMTGSRAGPVVVAPGGSTNGLYRERLLMQAGENAADRILKSVHLDIEIPKGP